MTNQFVYGNISLKKIAWGKRDGYLRVQLYDSHYNKVYDSKADLNNQKEVKRMFTELENKGCKLFKETSWF